MNCAYCGEEFSGRPVRQGDQIYCSIGCADMAAGVDIDEENDYYEEIPLDMDASDDEMSANW